MFNGIMIECNHSLSLPLGTPGWVNSLSSLSSALSWWQTTLILKLSSIAMTNYLTETVIRLWKLENVVDYHLRLCYFSLLFVLQWQSPLIRFYVYTHFYKEHLSSFKPRSKSLDHTLKQFPEVICYISKTFAIECILFYIIQQYPGYFFIKTFFFWKLNWKQAFFSTLASIIITKFYEWPFFSTSDINL